jgi:predicted ATP-binding protein involved in virulence
MVPAIHEYSDELARTLQKKLAESGELSQSLDRTFPARLLKRIYEKGPSELELSEKLAELERRREKLRAAGLLDEQKEMPLLPTEKLGEETRDVLAVYVEDAEKKLGVFDELARKIELFQGIINSRFLYKKLHISRRSGLVFTTLAGEPLPLGALSSGEQQEVVLLYELLFRLKPNSLVLIDEPEISLHVAWQKKFLEDLTKITELASFDVLIATHSPQIIHKRWDLTVELDSPNAEAELEAVSLS